jgi:hypothetical protein
LSTRSSLPVVGASFVPYHPGLTKKDTMLNKEHRGSPTTGSPPRRFLLLGAVTAIAVTVVALLVVDRDDKVASTSPPVSPGQTSLGTNTTATILNTKAEITARLRQILQVREKAFAERDARLFDDVYTSDCSCLQAGREAIAALKREKVLWRNRATSIEVQSATEVNDRLWEVIAVFVSNAFRIETEQGQLVREAPAERIRYRFLLVRSSDSDLWRLGSASPIEG